MGIVNRPDLMLLDEVRQLAQRLDAAEHSKRGDLIAEFAAHFTWSRSKVYAALREIGWRSGRKARADKGSTKQDIGALKDVAFAIKNGIRENGKATMKTPNAVSMLAQNGRKITVSNSRINRLLRREQMHLAAQQVGTPYQSMKTLHPNQVHEADPSLCLLYYLPDGSQQMIRDSESYKNKLDKLATLKFKVWRYTLTDHFSGAIQVKYYQAKGETQANLYDFLLYAWSKKSNVLIHGVPKVLLWDKGSANSAGAIKNALQALDVTAITHQAGNPRAKGSVEKANDIVECAFESRLAYEPVENVDQLNAAAEAWYNAYNANAIPKYDSRIRRKFMEVPQVRYALWQLIRKEHLRILPDMEICRQLLAGNEIERPVDRQLHISFKHPVSRQREHYDVAHIPGIHIGAKLRVSAKIYGENEVIATFANYQGEDQSYLLKPFAVDRLTGFMEHAPEIAAEYLSRPDTVVEQAAKATDARAFPNLDQHQIKKAKARGDVPFGGLDAHSHLHHVSGPAFIERPGERMSVPDRLQVEIKPLSQIEAKMRLRNLLGRAVSPDESALLKQWYPEGVLEDELPAIVIRLASPEIETAPKLVAVK